MNQQPSLDRPSVEESTVKDIDSERMALFFEMASADELENLKWPEVDYVKSTGQVVGVRGIPFRKLGSLELRTICKRLGVRVFRKTPKDVMVDKIVKKHQLILQICPCYFDLYYETKYTAPSKACLTNENMNDQDKEDSDKSSASGIVHGNEQTVPTSITENSKKTNVSAVGRYPSLWKLGEDDEDDKFPEVLAATANAAILRLKALVRHNKVVKKRDWKNKNARLEDAIDSLATYEELQRRLYWSDRYTLRWMKNYVDETYREFF